MRSLFQIVAYLRDEWGCVCESVCVACTHLCSCLFLCVYACMCIFACDIIYKCTYGSQRRSLGQSLLGASHFLFERVSLLAIGKLVRIARKLQGAGHLCLLSHHYWCLSFYVAFGHLTQALKLSRQVLYQLSQLPSWTRIFQGTLGLILFRDWFIYSPS